MGKLHARCFNPLKEFVVTQTEEGLAKYEAKTVNGLPLYDDEGRSLMVPATKIPPNAMMKWLRTEYPNAATEYIRHTSNPIWDGGKFVYPMEVFECRVWLHGRKGEPDANGFSGRETVEGAEFSPLESARTSSLMNALRTLGFGVDIEPQETYEEALDEGIERLRRGKMAPEGAILQKIGEGLYIGVGLNNEILEVKSIEKNGGSLKTIVDDVKKTSKKEAEEVTGPKEEPKEPVETSEEKTEEKAEVKSPEVPAEVTKPKEEPKESVEISEEKTEEKAEVKSSEVPAEVVDSKEKEEKPKKKKPGRPRKVSTEPKTAPESDETAPVDEIDDIFKSSPELSEIAKTKFVTLEGAADMLKEMSGKTFAEIYNIDHAVFKVITRIGFNYSDVVPKEMVEMARKVLEAKNNGDKKN